MVDTFVNIFVEPFQDAYIQKAFLGGSIISIVCGIVGCLIILRRMAFLGDALSHAMIAGVAGGYLFMKILFGIEAHAPGMLVGSLIAAILTVALIGFVSKVSRIKEDSAIGIMYTGIFAGGVVLVSVFRNYIHIDLMHFIMGDVLGISDTDLWASAISASIVLTVILLFFRQFKITSFDPIMAASIGIPVVLFDYLLTSCVSLVVVSAVSMVGVIMVVGLLITPAATAYLLSDKLGKMMFLAAIFGVSSVAGGLYLCVWLDSAGGGAIMLFSTLQFIFVLIVAPKYGMMARWIRLRNMVPQQTIEDVLLSVLRNGNEYVPITVIAKYIDDAKHLHRALNNLVSGELLNCQKNEYSLTDNGRNEANRILRAHRLWETYLAAVGVPDKDIHKTAHKLEHFDRESTVQYLDELLNHPQHDPHGKQIPQDVNSNK